MAEPTVFNDKTEEEEHPWLGLVRRSRCCMYVVASGRRVLHALRCPGGVLVSWCQWRFRGAGACARCRVGAQYQCRYRSIPSYNIDKLL